MNRRERNETGNASIPSEHTPPGWNLFFGTLAVVWSVRPLIAQEHRGPWGFVFYGSQARCLGVLLCLAGVFLLRRYFVVVFQRSRGRGLFMLSLVLGLTAALAVAFAKGYSPPENVYLLGSLVAVMMCNYFFAKRSRT